MHLVFGIVLITLVMMLVWETLVLIGLFIRLACYLIALPFMLLWLAIGACIELDRYFRRRRVAGAVGLDAVRDALEPESARGPAIALAQNSDGIWEPLR